VRIERIGDATLYLGDAFDILPDVRASLCITDPPYNFSTSSSGSKHQFWSDAVNSSRWFRDALALLKVSLRHQGAIWQFLNWKTFIPFQKAVWDCGLKIDSLMVWDKMWIGPGGDVGLRPSYELVGLVALDGWRLPDRGLSDIWRSQWASQRPNGHPAEKPEALVGRIINESPGEIVLDPFMGSGTVGVASVRSGRAFVGIELDEVWFDVACRRLEAAYSQRDLFVHAPVPVHPVDTQIADLFAEAAE